MVKRPLSSRAAAVVILTCLAPCTQALAVGQSGAQFLRIGVGARACAMGEAYAGVADDPTAIYWNPAGLRQVNGIQIRGMQNFWLMDMGYQYVAASFHAPLGCFGVAAAYSSSGKMDRYVDFVKTGDYGAYDMAGTVSYANGFSFLSYGVALKLIQQNIDSLNATGFAGDIGVLVSPSLPVNLKAGVVAQNLGPGIKFIEKADPMPLNMKGGVSAKLGPVLLAADVNKPMDNSFRANVGAEVSIKDLLFLRGGYNTAHSYSAGLGIRWRMVGVDYAFAPFADIDASHRISVQVRL